MKILGSIIGVVIVSALIFVCVDCAAGRTRHLECYVADHEYREAWTQVSTHTDSDGKTHISTTHHPEEFHLICQEFSSGAIDVQTTHSIYI